MTELDMLTQQTQDYIAANPSTITFSRPSKASDGAGGTTTAATPVQPQVVRMIRQSESGSVESRNRDGEVVRPEWVLMAMPDADILEDDTFMWQGHQASIAYVTDMGYELLCPVTLS